MKAINQRAKKVMDVLTEGVDANASDSKKIDNAKGAFMPVHVEFIGSCNLGAIYSIAHYYKQNGDLMRDPDMEFIKGSDGEYYPVSFWQDAPLIRDEVVTWKIGTVVGYNEKRQADLVTFANKWMKNIKEQQGLKKKMKTEPTIEMLEKALNRWHKNLFSDTKHADILRDTNVAKGKVAMIEHVLWWIDAVRRGEVSE